MTDTPQAGPRVHQVTLTVEVEDRFYVRPHADATREIRSGGYYATIIEGHPPEGFATYPDATKAGLDAMARYPDLVGFRIDKVTLRSDHIATLISMGKPKSKVEEPF